MLGQLIGARSALIVDFPGQLKWPSELPFNMGRVRCLTLQSAFRDELAVSFAALLGYSDCD